MPDLKLSWVWLGNQKQAHAYNRRRYALRLLHVALISLRRAHHDHSALGVADAASSAVDRALRVVHESITEKGDRGDLLRKRDERGELRSVEEMAGWAWDRVRTLGNEL